MIYDNYGDHANGGWGAGGIAMLILMIVLILGVVGFVFYLMRISGMTQASAAKPERHTPEQLLGDRLARGEIDPDEYRARLAALKEGAAGDT